MKNCPNCNSQMENNAVFCTTCGTKLADSTQQHTTSASNTTASCGAQSQYTPEYDPYDHTAKFDKKDISDNKLLCMLVYLTGFVGIIIAFLSHNSSPYFAFHLRQAIKITIIEAFLCIAAAVLVWTVIAPVAAILMLMVCLVIRIICFLQICSGKAVEPAIIRSFDFLK